MPAEGDFFGGTRGGGKTDGALGKWALKDLVSLGRHLSEEPMSAEECKKQFVKAFGSSRSSSTGPMSLQAGSLAGLSVTARGSSAADLTTRYIPSHTPSLETDSVGKSHRAPTPGPDTVVACHSCSCR
jgi:hypothetical protein